jgi:hypothetical protein
MTRYQNLTPAASAALAKMTAEQKAAFDSEFQRSRKSTGLAYLFWCFGLHYAYLGKWGLQVLFWCTLGGLLVWTIVDLFRMKGLVADTNGEKAIEVASKIRTLFLLALLALPLSAQAIDPDPSEPGAQQTAEARYQMSTWGLMSPPVGWHCEAALPDVYGPTFVRCEPDHLLIEQQERERAEWLEYREMILDQLRRHRSRR